MISQGHKVALIPFVTPRPHGLRWLLLDIVDWPKDENKFFQRTLPSLVRTYENLPEGHSF